MPWSDQFEPSADQLAMLRALADAPRYLIIRPRAWRPVTSIMPIRSQGGLSHLVCDAERRGDHWQLVTYRPDEEDLGPAEPPRINPLVWLIPLALLWLVAGRACWQAFH